MARYHYQHQRKQLHYNYPVSSSAKHSGSHHQGSSTATCGSIRSFRNVVLALFFGVVLYTGVGNTFRYGSSDELSLLDIKTSENVGTVKKKHASASLEHQNDHDIEERSLDKTTSNDKQQVIINNDSEDGSENGKVKNAVLHSTDVEHEELNREEDDTVQDYSGEGEEEYGSEDNNDDDEEKIEKDHENLLISQNENDESDDEENLDGDEEYGSEDNNDDDEEKIEKDQENLLTSQNESDEYGSEDNADDDEEKREKNQENLLIAQKENDDSEHDVNLDSEDNKNIIIENLGETSSSMDEDLDEDEGNNETTGKEKKTVVFGEPTKENGEVVDVTIDRSRGKEGSLRSAGHAEGEDSDETEGAGLDEKTDHDTDIDTEEDNNESLQVALLKDELHIDSSRNHQDYLLVERLENSKHGSESNDAVEENNEEESGKNDKSDGRIVERPEDDKENLNEETEEEQDNFEQGDGKGGLEEYNGNSASNGQSVAEDDDEKELYEKEKEEENDELTVKDDDEDKEVEREKADLIKEFPDRVISNPNEEKVLNSMLEDVLAQESDARNEKEGGGLISATMSGVQAGDLLVTQNVEHHGLKVHENTGEDNATSTDANEHFETTNEEDTSREDDVTVANVDGDLHEAKVENDSATATAQVDLETKTHSEKTDLQNMDDMPLPTLQENRTTSNPIIGFDPDTGRNIDINVTEAEAQRLTANKSYSGPIEHMTSKLVDLNPEQQHFITVRNDSDVFLAPDHESLEGSTDDDKTQDQITIDKKTNSTDATTPERDQTNIPKDHVKTDLFDVEPRIEPVRVDDSKTATERAVESLNQNKDDSTSGNGMAGLSLSEEVVSTESKSMKLRTSSTLSSNLEKRASSIQMNLDDKDCVFRSSPIYRKVFVYPAPGELHAWDGEILSEAGRIYVAGNTDSSFKQWPWVELDRRARESSDGHYDTNRSNVQYTTELLVRELITNPKSCLRTYDPDEADLFYVPYLPSTEHHRGINDLNNLDFSNSSYAQAILNILDGNDYTGWENLFGLTSKYWKRRNGTDHILVFSEPLHGLFHPLSKRGNYHYIYTQKQLAPPIIISVELSTTFVDMFPKCALKNILVPYPNPVGSWYNGVENRNAYNLILESSKNLTALRSSAALPAERYLYQLQQSNETLQTNESFSLMSLSNLPRPIGQYYKVGLHGECDGLRKSLAKAYRMCSRSNKVLIKNSINALEDYAIGMRLSTFCPCPGGDSPSSKRMFDAILAGCIPVILSHDFVWPFSTEFDTRADREYVPLLNPDDFSIRLNASNYKDRLLNLKTCTPLDANKPGLDEFLSSIPADEVVRLRKNLLRVAESHYSWYKPRADLPENPLKDGILPDGGIAHMLVNLLAERARGRLYPACEEELKQVEHLERLQNVNTFVC